MDNNTIGVDTIGSSLGIKTPNLRTPHVLIPHYIYPNPWFKPIKNYIG